MSRRSSAAAAALRSGSSAPPLPSSTLHADGVRRCWGSSFSTPAQRIYHDEEWGRALAPGSSRLLYKQLVLQSFQAGLSWSCIHAKAPSFSTRFEAWDYSRVARWGAGDVAAALADAGIVRNGAKVRAAVTNAAAAARLDAAAPGGFEAFVWRVCGGLPPAERTLQLASRSGTHMRATQRVDFAAADGVHPTVGVVAAVAAFKAEGFTFLGPTAMLSFIQAAGFANHHAPDCDAHAPAEAAYAAAAAAMMPPAAGKRAGAAAPAREQAPQAKRPRRSKPL